jgi:hypothetical protein
MKNNQEEGGQAYPAGKDIDNVNGEIRIFGPPGT